MRGLDFVIGGAQKGASTQLTEYVRRLVGVHLPLTENPAFESPNYEGGAVERLHEYIHGLRDFVAVGIKRPNYLGYEPAAERIARAFPDTTMMFALRHPTDRAVSAYVHYCLYGRVPTLPVSEGLRRLMAGDDLGSIRSHEILSWSRYATHLARFERYFPPEQIVVIGSNDLRSDPTSTMSEVCDRLGVSGNLNEVPPRMSNVGPRTMAELRARRAMHRAINTFDAETKVLTGRTRNPMRLGAGLAMRQASRAFARVATTKADSLTLDAETRAGLDEYFAFDVEYVGRHYAVKL